MAMTEPANESITTVMARAISLLAAEVEEQRTHLDDAHLQLRSANEALAQVVRAVDEGLWQDGQVNITMLVDRIQSMQDDNDLLRRKEEGRV